MSWTAVASNAITFADGNTGHVYTIPSGAPSAGQLDVLCINSATTVTSVASTGGATWTLTATFVGNQGSYLYYRIATGGEPAGVTVTTNGNFKTQISWSRWSAGTITADVHAVADVDNANGTTTPAVNTGTLGATGELVIAFAALLEFSGTAPTSPSWSTGYTPLTSVSSGTGATDVAAFVAYNAAAGTAAETPNVTWTNAALDRYILVQTFETTSSSGGSGHAAQTGSTVAALLAAGIL